MRQAFFDTYRFRSKTFLVYGNLNDIFISSDLQALNFEEHLLRVLKDRGFRRVIFYADSRTKGSFCLDRDSADFFFPSQGGAKKSAASLFAERRGRTRRMPARPGALSGNEERPETPPAESAGGAAEGSVQEEGTGEEEKQVKRRFAFRDKVLAEFVAEISPFMRRKDSRMAVVFCNIFNNSVDNAALRECILNDWEKYQEEGARNICLLLATESVPNPANVIDLLEQCRLNSKFVYQESRDKYLIPTQCFNVGLPGVDEIENYLKRIVRTGFLSEPDRRVRIAYADIPAIAAEIVCKSRQFRSGGDAMHLKQENLRDIIGRIERWFMEREGTETALDKETVGRIWGDASGRVHPASRLNRRGWEPVYELALRLQKQAQDFRALNGREETVRDVVSARLQAVDMQEEKLRPRIPHFVLMGNPGTGKTTMARLIGALLQEEGYLRAGHVVEVTKKDLTSSYVAGITHATMGCVDQAEEGVLFIDEAHLIGHKDGGVNNEGSGREIVSTLNAALTNPNHHFSLILAGYEKEMQEVFDLDPGFRSRFGDNLIVIEDYEPELLSHILLSHLKENGFLPDEALIKPIADEAGAFPRNALECFVKRIYDERNRETFGNARTMQYYAERAMKRTADTVVRQEDFYADDVDESWFSTEDVEQSLEDILRTLDENLVGMEDIREIFVDLAYEIRECVLNGGDIAKLPIRGMIIVGNPGTGKTTIAGMLGRLYHHFGILGSASVLQVSASEFASRYQGGSQEAVHEYIRKAQNRKGVLFVDEAHQLTSTAFDGRGALQAFMAPMTDTGKPFLPVFAIYRDMSEQFAALDPGLTSRLRVIELEDYTPEQLVKILELMCGKQGLILSEEARAAARRLCEKIYAERTVHTGNARRMERLLEDMNVRRRRRCFARGIDITTAEGKTFLAEDVT